MSGFSRADLDRVLRETGSFHISRNFRGQPLVGRNIG